MMWKIHFTAQKTGQLLEGMILLSRSDQQSEVKSMRGPSVQALRCLAFPLYFSLQLSRRPIRHESIWFSISHKPSLSGRGEAIMAQHAQE